MMVKEKNQNRKKRARTELPDIPNKLYFSIGEVSELCQVQPHVLRYWEQEFAPLQQVKRRGNRRVYQRKDVLLIRQIRHLLYDQGFKIDGARAELSGERKHIAVPEPVKQMMREVVSNLEGVLKELEMA